MGDKNVIKVSEGLLKGELVNNEYGGSYYSFKGIPYAEPPVGELRFKEPQPIKPWDGVRSAKEFGPICYQFDVFKKTPPSGSEDCLYLNVYTPDISPNIPLPVMVWIHGGGFVWGSGDDDVYGPEFLIRQDVILVTLNYRVGALGFLCLDTADVPGNAGMKDQVLALRWIQKNIKNFGGDPENITIFGESAGAASVNLHLLSPMSRGLFKRAIIQSGAATAYWGQAFEPREKAITLARKLGLYTEDVKELFTFLKKQPIESLINLSLPVTFAEKETSNLEFAPTVEKDFGQERFLANNVYELLSNGIHKGVDVMMGYNEDEGMLCFYSHEVLDKNIEQVNSFREALVPKVLTRNIPIKEQLEVGRKMRKFYFDNKLLTKEDWKQLMKYYKFHLFAYDIVQFQKSIAKFANKNRSYFYKFTCKSKRNFFIDIFTADDIPKDEVVVCHCDDLAYLFPVKFMEQKVEKSSKEFKFIEKVTKLWTNFAKYGNPTPDESLDVTWEPYCLQHQRYMDIGEDLVMKTKPDDEDIQFWEKIFKEYFPRSTI